MVTTIDQILPKIPGLSMAPIPIETMGVLLSLLSTASLSSVEEILAEFTEKTVQASAAAACIIWRGNTGHNTLTKVAGYPLTGPEIPANENTLAQQSCALPDYPAREQVLHQGIPHLIGRDDLEIGPTQKSLLESLQVQDGLILPLLYQGQAIGLLELYGVHPDQETLPLYQVLANQVAMILQNHWLAAELASQQESLRQIFRKLVQAQEEERRHISRDLHDELGQGLTALKINLDLAQQALPARPPAQLQRTLNEAKSLAVQILETARCMSLKLRPAILDELGLEAALRWEINRYEQRTGQAVYFEIQPLTVALPPELEITLYRIIIEALTNVTRHAQANQVWVEIHRKNGRVIASVEDDGQGFETRHWFASPARRKSLGLTSMQERAALLGGELAITSAPGQGTRVQVALPLH